MTLVTLVVERPSAALARGAGALAPFTLTLPVT